MLCTHNVGRCALRDKLKHRFTSRRFQSVVDCKTHALGRIGVEHCECPVVTRHVGGSDVGAGQCPQAPDTTSAT